jgi:hypothetical protein
MKSHFKLEGDPRAMYGVTADEAQSLLAGGRVEELLERVYAAYEAYKQGMEFVIVEGATVRRLAWSRMPGVAGVGGCLAG